jgi:hypothetical protein
MFVLVFLLPYMVVVLEVSCLEYIVVSLLKKNIDSKIWICIIAVQESAYDLIKL